LAAIVHRPRHTLKAEPLEATTKTITEDAIGLAVEGQVANRIGLHCLCHYRERGRTAGKLLLAFWKVIDAAKVIADGFDKIAEPPRRLAAAVQTIDAK
jgi:hypothetical protein